MQASALARAHTHTHTHTHQFLFNEGLRWNILLLLKITYFILVLFLLQNNKEMVFKDYILLKLYPIMLYFNSFYISVIFRYKICVYVCV